MFFFHHFFHSASCEWRSKCVSLQTFVWFAAHCHSHVCRCVPISLLLRPTDIWGLCGFPELADILPSQAAFLSSSIHLKKSNWKSVGRCRQLWQWDFSDKAWLRVGTSVKSSQQLEGSWEVWGWFHKGVLQCHWDILCSSQDFFSSCWGSPCVFPPHSFSGVYADMSPLLFSPQRHSRDLYFSYT